MLKRVFSFCNVFVLVTKHLHIYASAKTKVQYICLKMFSKHTQVSVFPSNCNLLSAFQTIIDMDPEDKEISLLLMNH